jgi:putative colanic acid biosynthesis acetyltransferase WcaF
MRLDRYNARGFDRGRPAWIEALWIIVQALLVSSFIPGSAHRAVLLRLFGARIGEGVVLKPRMRVKFPWRLEIGNHSWIGEGAWIDNLDTVSIGSHCCISQGAFFCTGSHNWTSETFDLETKPITVGDHAWIGARSVVAPGVTVGEGAVLVLGSVATRDLSAWWVHQGNPAEPVKERKRAESPNEN